MSRKKTKKRRERSAVEITEQTNTGQSVHVQQSHSNWLARFGWVAAGALVASLLFLIFSDQGAQTERFAQRDRLVQLAKSQGPRRVWQLIDLSDAELEKVDLVEMNLAVAQEIPGLEKLDVTQYQQAVDRWTEQIKASLPAGERAFEKTPEQWQNDIRFFRLGQVASFLNQGVGIDYVEAQKNAKTVQYVDPADLFLHGLIDRQSGTCGNMPVLHVAIARRLGWPVSLAAVGAHTVCRYDDGEVVYNIETTSTENGGMFAAATDAQYVQRFKLPQQAISSGSDLTSMTAREMLGYFISLRARHFADTGQIERADRDYSLARVLLPNHRKTYLASQGAAMAKGSRLFEPSEPGHPNAGQQGSSQSMEAALAETEQIHRLNEQNRRRLMSNPFSNPPSSSSTSQFPAPNLGQTR